MTALVLMPNVDQSRVGDWIQTFTGRCFWPLDPRPDEVHIEDIAHSLAMRCRYGGHCVQFYSVAEHSVLVSRHVPIEHALWGLLHDAAEAYSADVPRPIKRHIKQWRTMESDIMATVCDRFGLGREEPDSVKRVDAAMLSTERAVLMSACEGDWGEMAQPVDATIACFDPMLAKFAFMQRFREIVGGHT